MKEGSSILIILLSLGMLILMIGSIMLFRLYLKKRIEYFSNIIQLKQDFEQILLKSQLEIQEQTLAQVSREIHSNLSNLGSIVQINLKLIKPQNVEETKEKIIELISLNGQLLNELKALSVGLNTEHIKHIGFLNALRNEVERLRKTKAFKVDFSVMGDSVYLKPEKEIILFRLCQEIINNVIRHSKADTLRVQVNNAEKELWVEIEDDGVGFDPSPEAILIKSNRSTGLLNIRTRAKMIDAHVGIISEPGKGTKAKIIVPGDKTIDNE